MTNKAITCISMAMLPCAVVMAQGRTRPNIVLIMADDMGQECIGCYGSTYNTPNIDRLAEIGMRFNNGFSQPLSTPSRVQLMTGKYNNRNYSNFGFLNHDQKTFAHLAKNAGYATMISGKWQLGSNRNLPEHFGFDNYCLWQLSYERFVRERYAAPLIEQDGKIRLYSEDEYGPDIFTAYVNDFIEDNKDRPFFVYYPMVLVHNPFFPTPDSREWKDKDLRELNSNDNFPQMVEYVDKNVGLIIDKLETLSLLENTIIIFIGDNGTNTAISTPMKDGSIVKGGKGKTTDNGVRVPMIAYCGGSTYRNHICEDMVDFTDFMPTFAEAMGVKVPEEWGTEGQSFLPQIQGRKGKAREWVFCHYDAAFNGKPENRAREFFRDVRYKLYSTGKFYDTVNDPQEKHPIEKGCGSRSAEKSRKKLEKLFRTVPEWKKGDPLVPMCIYDEYPLEHTPKETSIDTILENY